MNKKRILIVAVLMITFVIFAIVIWKKPWSGGASGQESVPTSSESSAEPSSGTETDSGGEGSSYEDSPEEEMETGDGDVYEIEESEGETGELI